MDFRFSYFNVTNKIFHNFQIHNPTHHILEYYNVLVQVHFTKSKIELISSIRNFIYMLPHELSKNLRFT